MKLRKILLEKMLEKEYVKNTPAGKKIMYTLFKNPSSKEIQECARYGQTRGVILKKSGNLYISDGLNVTDNKKVIPTHVDLINALKKTGVIGDASGNLHVKYSIPENFDKLLAIESETNSTSVWLLSESYEPKFVKDLIEKYQQQAKKLNITLK